MNERVILAVTHDDLILQMNATLSFLGEDKACVFKVIEMPPSTVILLFAGIRNAREANLELSRHLESIRPAHVAYAMACLSEGDIDQADALEAALRLGGVEAFQALRGISATDALTGINWPFHEMGKRKKADPTY